MEYFYKGPIDDESLKRPLLRTAYVIPVLDLVRVLTRVFSYQRCRPYLKQQKQHTAVPKRKTPTVGMVMVKVLKLGSIKSACHQKLKVEKLQHRQITFTQVQRTQEFSSGIVD